MRQLIPKEDIAQLSFPVEDVLFNEKERTYRRLTIERALALGNLEQSKVRIAFRDVEGTKVVETTIWGVTDKDIILKKGTVIPIPRIISVKIV